MERLRERKKKKAEYSLLRSVAGEEDLFEFDVDLPRGFLSSPAISRVFVDCSMTPGAPHWVAPGEGSGGFLYSSLGLRRVPLFSVFHRLAEARLFDPCLKWDRQARWPRKHAATKFWAIQSFVCSPEKTDGTQRSPAGLPPQEPGGSLPEASTGSAGGGVRGGGEGWRAAVSSRTARCSLVSR